MPAILAFGAWLMLSFVWGSTWPIIKIGLADLPPFLFAAIRFLTAGSILLAGCLLIGTKLWPERRDWVFLTKTGLLIFSANYGLLFWGQQFIASGLASVLHASIPAFTLVIAHLLRLPGERLTARRIVGAVLGLVGVALIFSRQLHSEGLQGFCASIAIILAAAAFAYASVLIKIYDGGLKVAPMAGWQMLLGATPLLVLGWLREGSPISLRWTVLGLSCLLYLAIIASSLAFVVSYWLVRRVSVTATMTISFMIPLVASVLAFALLGEKLSWPIYCGAAALLCGIALIVFRSAGRSALHIWQSLFSEDSLCTEVAEDRIR